MSQSIEQVVAQAQGAFWAAVAAAFPEITSGDFPPDASLAFDGACISAVNRWVKGNTPTPVLSEDDLVALGYTIKEDLDQPGLWLWTNDTEGSFRSFASKAEAIEDASNDARGTFELCRCDNCGNVSLHT